MTRRSPASRLLDQRTSMTSVAYPHIEVRPGGTAYVAGTVTKVVEIVLDRLAYHWDADEIRRQHPHLSLPQIYCALAYYYEHQVEIDRQIEEQLESVDAARRAAGESLVRVKRRRMSGDR